MCKKIVLIFFLENRALKHIDELFGESTNSSESEEETIADVARGAKLKRQLSVRTRTIQEVEEESESEQQHVEMPPTPEIFPAEREPSPQDWYSSGGDHQTTPRFSPQHSSIEESESEKFDCSSEGSTFSPPKNKKRKAAKQKDKQPKEKNKQPKKAGKSRKQTFTVDGSWSGDEREGVPTVDPRQGKKFTRAGRKKSGRKTKQNPTRGRKPNRQLTLQEEIDTPVLFDIPDNARLLPSRAQLKGVAEAGYAVDPPLDLPDVDEDDLPTDHLGEENVQPMGGGAVPPELVETHDQYIRRMVQGRDEPVPIWDVRITTKQGFEWVCGDCNSANMPPIRPLPTFVPMGPVGPNIPGLANMHPCVVLEQFIPMSMYARIAQETNAYRARCKESGKNADLDELDVYDAPGMTDELIQEHDRDYDVIWENQSIGSVVRYMGIHVGMAIRPRRNISDYWSKDSYGCLTADNFGRYMSRNRFNVIKKYFYINHAKEEHFDAKGRLLDPWHKLRPFIDVVQENLLKNWNIGQWNSIDEGKIAYHGCCCPVLTFDRAKPIKWGMKVFMGSCAKTGYPWWILPWEGAEMRIRGEDDWDYQHLNLGTRVVLNAAQHMPAHAHAFTDRYFTSFPTVKLAHERHSVLVTGTVKSDKPGIPWEYLCDWNQDGSERGYYRWAFNEHFNMYAALWKDRNIVPMLSMGFGVEHNTVNRGGGGPKKRGKLKGTKVPYGRYVQL